MKLFLVLPLLFAVQTSSADYSGAVTAGTGGAGRAAIEASEGPFNNPATIPYLNGYYFTSGIGSSVQNGVVGNDLTLSLTDNMKETVLPTSLAYGQSVYNMDSGEQMAKRQLRLSFGGYWTKKITSGLAFIYQDDKMPTTRFTQTNLTAGVEWVPNKDLGFAMVVENLMPASEAIPIANKLKKTTGGGMVMNYMKLMRFKADVVSGPENNFLYPTLALGVENYLNKWIIFRVGAQRNNFEQFSLYTAGVGFVLPKFGLQFAYQTSQENPLATRHTVDLAVPIW